MSALFNPHSDLVMLSAHRGIHALAGLNQASGVPENPLESIGLAAQAGWEMIELDVKLTSDGVPMLSHDRTWGRQWCALTSGLINVPYDPFTLPGSSSNDSVNPAVNGTKLSDTRSFLGNTVLRDSVSLLNPNIFHGCNGFHQIFVNIRPPWRMLLTTSPKTKSEWSSSSISRVST
jgi:glycerophosphoryl diester phosphodiesterase